MTLAKNLWSELVSRYKVAKKVFSCLSASERSSFLASSFVIFLANLLDLVGIFLFGLIGMILLNVNSQTLHNFTKYIPWLDSQNRTLTNSTKEVFVLILTIFIFFILKSILNIFGMRYLFSNLALAASRLSVESLLRVNAFSLTKFRKFVNSDRQFLAMQSTQSAIYDVLGYTTLVLSEIVLLLLLGIFYVFVTEAVGVATLMYFVFCLIISQKIISRKMHNSEMIRIDSHLNSIEVINGQFGVFSYLKNANVFNWFNSKLYPLRYSEFSAISKLQLLANLPKFMLEILLIAGVILVSVLQMFIDPSNLALNLGLFFVTSLRFMPSIARLQSYINQVDRGSQGSEMFLEIFEKNEVVQSSKFSNFLKIESSNLISAKNINVSIEGRDLFSFEELLLPPKGLVVIHGESGCGKSTLLSLLAGIDELNEDSEGKIINFANETIYISQFTSLLPFTIKENILLDLESTAENIERYQTLIELLNLQNTLENDNSQRTMRTGFTLSGGELQRIGIARGLMRKSRFYFLDEPSASLDAVNRNAVWKLLKNESRKALIVVATHDIEGLSFADLVYRIQNKALILDSNG